MATLVQSEMHIKFEKNNNELNELIHHRSSIILLSVSRWTSLFTCHLITALIKELHNGA